MAEKPDVKALLKDLALVQKGMVVAEPVSDNYAVHPKQGSALAVIPGHQIVAILSEAYPRCVFTWCAAPYAAPAPKEAPQT